MGDLKILATVIESFAGPQTGKITSVREVATGVFVIVFE